MAGHTRTKAAESANDQIDRNAGVRGLAQGFDHVRVFQLVHLGDDAGGLAGALVLYFAMDQVEQPRPHGHRSDQDGVEIGLIGVAGQVVEEIDHVVGDAMVAGEQADIGIEARGLHVVVSGADVHVAAQAPRFLAHHQRCLAVGLEPADAKGDVGADAFQFGRPMEIAFLVEARLDLHHAGHLLAPFGCPYQRFHERRVVADAVGSHLDQDRLRIIGCRTDEVLDARVEAFIRMMHQQVGGLHGGEDRALSLRQRRWPQRRPFGVAQGGKRKTEEFKQRGVVQLFLHLVDIDWAQLEACSQHLGDRRVRPGAKFQAYHRFVAPLANLFLDHGAKVCRRIIVQFHLGIAREPHQGDVRDFHAGVEAVQIAANDLV